MLRLGKFLDEAGISAGFSLLFFDDVKDVYLAIPDNVLDYMSRMDILIHCGMIAYHFTCCNELQLNKENVHNIFNAFIAELTLIKEKVNSTETMLLLPDNNFDISALMIGEFIEFKFNQCDEILRVHHSWLTETGLSAAQVEHVFVHHLRHFINYDEHLLNNEAFQNIFD